jgi:hypothetical protein
VILWLIAPDGLSPAGCVAGLGQQWGQRQDLRHFAPKIDSGMLPQAVLYLLPIYLLKVLRWTLTKGGLFFVCRYGRGIRNEAVNYTGCAVVVWIFREGFPPF